MRCQELYFQCLRVASHLMKANREYTELLELCSAACNLYPYEECQIMKIDCLIAMKRFKDAMQVYDQAVAQYFEEQGLPPSEKMLERFRTMSGQIRYTSDTLKDARESLQERTGSMDLTIVLILPLSTATDCWYACRSGSTSPA